MSVPANLLTVWSELLFDALVRAGVRDVVVSPGSRSTPFVLAAARHPELRCHPILDERAAAFFALGMARVTGRAPLVLCTSGTAPAHYLPAVIEASEAALPLLVLSADRPSSLSACGAPQTTDQQRLFGVHARFFADLGTPEPSAAALRGMRRLVARAVSEAHGPFPGPVHLDARADKPLEPRAAETPQEHALAELAAGIVRDSLVTVPPPRLRADRAALATVAAVLRRAERPALVAGPLGLDEGASEVLALAREHGLALFAEATSQLRYGPREGVVCADAFDRWLERAPADALPDVVLEVGGTPTSGAYLRWTERGGARARFVLGGSRFRDPAARADAVVLGELTEAVHALRSELPERAVSGSFRTALEREERRTWAAVEGALAEAGLAEGTVARALVEALPEGALLGLGNSLPIRHADRFVRGGGASLRVLSQRGVNGIDGAVAGIVGAAQADGRPAALLVGDVTLAHDVGSLALAARLASPLAIVVLDNAGGRIFDQLPVGQAGLTPAEHALFTTPPRIAFDATAAAFGVAYARVENPSGLRSALRDALARPGATLVHAIVPPDGVAALEARIAARMRDS
jgi:2-succinyl-5-enolpyruvyl-6-hydroxy-3-cyclohexene-1-carboxylate synthase